MKYYLLTLITLVFLLQLRNAEAQQRPVCSGVMNARAAGILQAHTWPKRPLDVQSYKLLLDWRPIFKNQNHLFNGMNEISLHATAPIDTILLDAADMRIDSLWINGTLKINPPQPTTDGLLPIVLSSMASAGDQFDLRIAYSRTSDSNGGIWFYPKKTFTGYHYYFIDTILHEDSSFTAEDVAYTMSEAIEAHRWMPCVDLPSDKAQSQISIIVPSGISAQSNGHLDSVTSNADGSSTYHWKSDEVLSPYLMVADASAFVEWKDYYKRIAAPHDSVLVDYYAWKSDYDQTADTTGILINPQFALKNTPLMIAAFSKRFGEYPFKSYGQVPVAPFSYGGMEHQTMTTLDRESLYSYSDNLIAHELMHQWFGDKTTCETWSDAWLNESFATLGEWLWDEDHYGSASYASDIFYSRLGFFSDGQENVFPVYDPPFNEIMDIFTVHSTTTYTKGGLVLHTLRRMLANDTMFFGALRDYSNAFAFTTANTSQLENFLSGRLGMDMSSFFDEWIYGVRWPVYKIQWAQYPDNSLAVRITQTQGSPSPQIFHVPVHLIQYANGGIPDTAILSVSSRDQYYHIPSSGKLDSLIFDQDAIPVSRATVSHNPSLSITQAEAAKPDFTIRNEEQNIILSWNLPSGTKGNINIFDMLGRSVREFLIDNPISHAVIPSSQLANGTYIAHLITQNRNETVKFRIIR